MYKNSNKNVGAVILSRYSSSRLPGKALIKIKDKEILKYIIERLEKVFKREYIVIATSTEKSDDVIDEFAKKENIDCYRGSLNDVASRFYEAACKRGWEYAARVCGDSIFVNIEALNSMLGILNKKHYDFISNVKNRTFPIGMSAEIVNLKYFGDLLKKIKKSKRYKEHVTLYIYEEEESGNHYFYYNKKVPEAARITLSLDTAKDLEQIRKIINQFTKPHWKYNLEEIFEIWQKIKGIIQ